MTKQTYQDLYLMTIHNYSKVIYFNIYLELSKKKIVSFGWPRPKGRTGPPRDTPEGLALEAAGSGAQTHKTIVKPKSNLNFFIT